MALGDILWASGFDNRDIGVFDLNVVGVSQFKSTGIGPRTPKSSFYYNGSVTALGVGSLAAAGVKEFVVGGGFAYTTLQAADFFRLSSPNSVDNFAIGLDAGGHLRIRRGTADLAAGPTVLAINTWYWVWSYVKIGDAGRYRITLNNVSEIAAANGDTRSDAGTNGDTADRFTLGTNNYPCFDDWYVIDATGTTNDGDDCSPGEVTIPFLLPSAAGDTTQLTRGGTDSGANWSQVEEVPPNDGTDYNGHATDGNLDLYNIANLPSGVAAVKGVVVRTRSQKSDAGAKSGRALVKSGATVSNGPDFTLTSGSWQSNQRPLRQNPVTAADWTTSELDALQVGFEARP